MKKFNSLGRVIIGVLVAMAGDEVDRIFDAPFPDNIEGH